MIHASLKQAYLNGHTIERRYMNGEYEVMNNNSYFTDNYNKVKQNDFSGGKLKYWKGANSSPVYPAFLFSTKTL